jgi:hypothetical protein
VCGPELVVGVTQKEVLLSSIACYGMRRSVLSMSCSLTVLFRNIYTGLANWHNFNLEA